MVGLLSEVYYFMKMSTELQAKNSEVTLFLDPGSYPLGNTMSLKLSIASPALFNILSSSGTENKMIFIKLNEFMVCNYSEIVTVYVHAKCSIKISARCQIDERYVRFFQIKFP